MSDNQEEESTGKPADERSPVCVASTDPQASSAFWSRRIEKRQGGGGLPFDFIQLDNPADIAKLKQHYRLIVVDTPGSIDDEHLLMETLQQTDEVLVPILTEGLSFEPATRTIEQVVEAMDLPYKVVVNGWDPRDGEKDLVDTARFIRRKGWPVCNTVVRRYKIHTRGALEGKVVTQYAKNRVAMEARSDFYQLALELGLGGSIGHDDAGAKVLCLACQKGGVGKTTITMNLAAVANETLSPGRLQSADGGVVVRTFDSVEV